MKPYVNLIGICIITCILTIIAGRLYKSSSYKNAETLVNKWIDKTIVIPDSMTCITIGKNAIQKNISNADYIVLKYVDSIGCTACKLRLPTYIQWINDCSTRSNKTIELICIVATNNENELRNILRKDNVQIPILLDKNDVFNSLNQIEKFELYHTFLLDRHFKVQAIGDPLKSGRIKTLYESILCDNNECHQADLTYITSDTDFIDLGKVLPGDTLRCQFHITNRGVTTFLANAITPSCECVVASMANTTIPPGKTGTIDVTFTETYPIGDFIREIDINGNISPRLTLTIGGTVVNK